MQQTINILKNMKIFFFHPRSRDVLIDLHFFILFGATYLPRTYTYYLLFHTVIFLFPLSFLANFMRFIFNFLIKNKCVLLYHSRLLGDSGKIL